jgi:hypothetical protein
MSLENFAKHLVERGMLKATTLETADEHFYELLKPTWAEFLLDNGFSLDKMKKVVVKKIFFFFVRFFFVSDSCKAQMSNYCFL